MRGFCGPCDLVPTHSKGAGNDPLPDTHGGLLRCRDQPFAVLVLRLPLLFPQCALRGSGLVGIPWIAHLTIRSRGCRFAAPLNSGVRPLDSLSSPDT